MGSRQSSFEKKRSESIAFLSHKIDSTPWHTGPMEPETLLIAKDLIEINRLGLVTLTSQPGLKILLTDKLIQRAYVECICLADMVPKVMEMIKHANLWVHSNAGNIGDEDVVLTECNKSVT